MCGEIKPWQWAHQVVVRFDAALLEPFNVTSPASQIINLNRMLEHVAEVRLTEYYVDCTPGANTRHLWRVNLSAQGIEEEVSSNAAGKGHCFIVPNIAAGSVEQNHVVYDNPRVVSYTCKTGITSLHVQVSTDAGTAPSYNQMIFMFTFVMNKPDWSPELVNQNDLNKLEPWRSNQFVGRFRP